MLYDDDPMQFVAKNYDTLSRMVLFIAHTSLREEVIHDHIMDMAWRMRRQDLLRRWDANKSSLATWVWRILASGMSTDATRNRRAAVVTYVPHIEDHGAPSEHSHRDEIIDIMRFAQYLLTRNRKLYIILRSMLAGRTQTDIANESGYTVGCINNWVKQIRLEHKKWAKNATVSRTLPRRTSSGILSTTPRTSSASKSAKVR